MISTSLSTCLVHQAKRHLRVHIHHRTRLRRPLAITTVPFSGTFSVGSVMRSQDGVEMVFGLKSVNRIIPFSCLGVGWAKTRDRSLLGQGSNNRSAPRRSFLRAF